MNTQSDSLKSFQKLTNAQQKAIKYAYIAKLQRDNKYKSIKKGFYDSLPDTREHIIDTLADVNLQK